MASLYVKDAEANDLADRLASRRGVSKTAAVKLALRNELDRDIAPVPLRERLRTWRTAYPLGESTGLSVEKAFYDSLNDEDQG